MSDLDEMYDEVYFVIETEYSIQYIKAYIK